MFGGPVPRRTGLGVRRQKGVAATSCADEKRAVHRFQIYDDPAGSHCGWCVRVCIAVITWRSPDDDADDDPDKDRFGKESFKDRACARFQCILEVTEKRSCYLKVGRFSMLDHLSMN